jgi:hypothetical protein
MNKELQEDILYLLEAWDRGADACNYRDEINDAIVRVEALAQPEHLVTKEVSLPEQDWEGIAADQAMTIALLKSEQEPLEYWNAVEGWVKIDEVRKHFDSAGCGTIYKTAGEGRAPLYASPNVAEPRQKREWVGLTDDERAECWSSSAKQSAINIEAKLKEKNT